MLDAEQSDTLTTVGAVRAHLIARYGEPMARVLENGEVLALPDRHARLDLRHEPVDGGERLCTVGGGDDGDEGDVTDEERSGAVRRRDPQARALVEVRARGAQHALGLRVGAVVEPPHGRTVVVVAHDTAERHDGAVRGGGGPRLEGGGVQRLIGHERKHGLTRAGVASSIVRGRPLGCPRVGLSHARPRRRAGRAGDRGCPRARRDRRAPPRGSRAGRQRRCPARSRRQRG